MQGLQSASIMSAEDLSDPAFASTANHAPAHYDIIIAGAGAAGLSLLVRIIKSGNFEDKQILLIDLAPKTLNDRTWCFWEKGDGMFEDVVFRSWPTLAFHADDYSGRFNIHPYRYKMIRGIDFYNHCFALIAAQNNVTVRYGTVRHLQSDGNSTSLLLDDERITATYIFNSIIFEKPSLKNGEYYLLQHFKGWIIQTPRPFFNVNEATLMDFRVGQQNGTTFIYVMPLSADTALVEYTLFSKSLLETQEYNAGLDEYIKRVLDCRDYNILDEEFGIIPMTNFRFPSHQGNIIHIGTAGGQTKPSSGYTFQFIQKRTAFIVDQLSKGLDAPARAIYPAKFRFYDSVLLNVLATGKLSGSEVFTHLFRKNPSARIFRFLDNESTLIDDLQLISTLPTMPFLKAAWERLVSI